MKYFMIAGEASGDLHGANLVRAIRQQDTAADVRAWGGDMMSSAGAVILKHYRELAFMGFAEVVLNLRTILRNIKTCKSQIIDYQPDALILVDYPGFNLRIAKWAKARGIKVFYYVSPQIWAWHTSRVHGIIATTNRVFAILPFEPDFYKSFGYEVSFLGHPLLDVVENLPEQPQFRTQNDLDEHRPIVALLPGSRRQEVSNMLAIMLKVADKRPDYQFVVAGAPALPIEFYQDTLQPHPNVKFVTGQTYALLQHAAAAFVTSGTATLETALFNVPQVVCYKANPISYAIARRVVKVPYISLVNLIANKTIVTELIQNDLTPDRLLSEFDRITSPDCAENMRNAYQQLRSKLGNSGVADRVATEIMERLRNG